MKCDRKLNPEQVVDWLLRQQRKVAVGGLTDLVCQVMEQRNDYHSVKRILHAKPELQEYEGAMRHYSQTLGVPLWYLLKLLVEKPERCYAAAAAAHLIHQLRVEGSAETLAAMEHLVERLRPVMDGHPGMTVGEGLRALKDQTDETTHRLDSTDGV
jgi:hypothetical protein